jgi:tRNA pseudouridine38-40 synthase
VQDVGESLLPRWGRLIEIRVVGDAFLPRQVRGMVGALLEVGQGRRTSESVAALLREPRRQDGPKTAPAHGLVLWEVGYTPWGTDSGPMAEK